MVIIYDKGISRQRNMMHLTVCYYHVTYEFQSESSLAKWLSVRLQQTKSLWVQISLLSLITKYKIGSTSNLGAKTWNLLLGEIKISFSFSIFKNEIRNLRKAKPNEKYRLYLISLRYLLDLLFYYDFKFNPF